MIERLTDRLKHDEKGSMNNEIGTAGWRNSLPESPQFTGHPVVTCDVDSKFFRLTFCNDNLFYCKRECQINPP